MTDRGTDRRGECLLPPRGERDGGSGADGAQVRLIEHPNGNPLVVRRIGAPVGIDVVGSGGDLVICLAGDLRRDIPPQSIQGKRPRDGKQWVADHHGSRDGIGIQVGSRGGAHINRSGLDRRVGDLGRDRGLGIVQGGHAAEAHSVPAALGPGEFDDSADGRQSRLVVGHHFHIARPVVIEALQVDVVNPRVGRQSDVVEAERDPAGNTGRTPRFGEPQAGAAGEE